MDGGQCVLGRGVERLLVVYHVRGDSGTAWDINLNIGSFARDDSKISNARVWPVRGG